MTIIRMVRWCIQVQILGGEFDGTRKILPRIKLSTTEGELPFILTRKQFPIRLSFAMTVYMAQGQSLDVVGIDLREPAITHGQLYVALSRVMILQGLMVDDSLITMGILNQEYEVRPPGSNSAAIPEEATQNNFAF